MGDRIIVLGKAYPVLAAELHLPLVDGRRCLFLSVAGGPRGQEDGVTLGHVEFALLDSLDALDGKRLHLSREGESFPDDTLGGDAIGIGEDMGWSSSWTVNGDAHVLGEIQLDFSQVRSERYRCRLVCTLRRQDPMTGGPAGDEMLELVAEFTADVDEVDLLAGCR